MALHRGRRPGFPSILETELFEKLEEREPMAGSRLLFDRGGILLRSLVYRVDGLADPAEHGRRDRIFARPY
ncbi:UNVERIFIED_ORG: CTP:molybdopterin cytidylyltransferase MocA [Rhizobium esperanzae]